MRFSFIHALLILLVFFQIEAQTVKNIGTGTSFTCLSYDGEGNLWAGTRSEGLWKASVDTTTGKIESGGLSLFSSDANFNKYQIQSIATPTVNGRTSVWVGSRGTGGGTASGGGVHHFLTTSATEAQYYVAERDKVVAKGMRLPAMKNDGTPSRDCKSLAVDKNGTVWSAHGYHDLVITGTVQYIINPYTGLLENYSVKGGYYVTPGGIGMKKADKPVFDNRSNLDETKYPAYTIDTPIEKTAQTRIHLSVGVGNDQVWAGVAAFEDVSGNISPTGIMMYDFAGNFHGKLDYTNTPELPFTSSFASPRAYSIHFQKNDTPWLTFNQNKGFAMMKNFGYNNAEWVHVDTLNHYNTITGAQEVSTMFTNGIPTFGFSSGLIASAGRRVFLGTTAGLLVYDGHGDVKQDSSYTLVTTAEGLSSNYITGVTTGGGYVYITTDQGVDQIFIPSDLTIFHVDRKESPFEYQDQNYMEMSTMTTLKGMNNISYNQDDLPMFSADGTTSSVFRYYTDDFDGFYQQEEKYLFGLSANFRNEDTAKYGKFILKPLEYYEDDKKEYVDIIFRHPMYVDEAFVSKGEDAIYDFVIAKKNALTEEPLFKNYVKITTPPVLLVHGVWTNINSLVSIETSLREKGNYQPFKVLKIYKLHKDDGGNTAEKPFSGDAHEIPDGINRLRKICSSNNLSAGKVSLVVHSRGGLYSRAYIEELEPGIDYNFDIHSLITLNTPHAGSQLANAVMDERIVTIKIPITTIPRTYKNVEFKLGTAFTEAGMSAAPEDQIEKNGAKVLLVDEGFIRELNKDDNLKKLKQYKVPIHAVATDFKISNINLDSADLSVALSRHLYNFNKLIKLSILHYGIKKGVANGLDNFMLKVFNGEGSDFIVPRSSMEAGLPYPYLTTMHEYNIAHIDMFKVVGTEGVATSQVILNRVIELLGQNVYSPTANFSLDGLNPPRKDAGNELVYNLFGANEKQETNNGARTSVEEFPEGVEFYFDRADSLKSYLPGDTIRVKLITKKITTGLLMFESPNEDFENTIDDIEVFADTNLFTYIIPTNYFGEITVIGYGATEDQYFFMDSLTFNVEVPDSISLTNIYFSAYSEVVEMEQMESYNINLEGLYSDSTIRNFTTNPDVFYYLTDTTIAQFTGSTVKGLKQGKTYLIAVYDNKIDSLQFVVYENPNLTKTIIGDFYVSVNADSELLIDWTISQSYKCERIVVEYSDDNVNFTPLFSVPGNGTQYKQKNYAYTDLFDSDSSVFYRLRIIDSTDNPDIFSLVREVTPVEDVVMSVMEEEYFEEGFSIFPNPVHGGKVSLSFNSPVAATAEVQIKNLHGELINTSKFNLQQGDNSLLMNFPDFVSPGVYIIHLTTVVDSYSKKVILTK